MICFDSIDFRRFRNQTQAIIDQPTNQTKQANRILLFVLFFSLLFCSVCLFPLPTPSPNQPPASGLPERLCALCASSLGPVRAGWGVRVKGKEGGLVLELVDTLFPFLFRARLATLVFDFTQGTTQFTTSHHPQLQPQPPPLPPSTFHHHLHLHFHLHIHIHTHIHITDLHEVTLVCHQVSHQVRQWGSTKTKK